MCFGDHAVEGLYMLQYRKFEDEACCIKKRVTASLTSSCPCFLHNGKYYLPFENTCSKLVATKKDYPSLQQKQRIKTKYQTKLYVFPKETDESLACNPNFHEQISSFWKTFHLWDGFQMSIYS